MFKLFSSKRSASPRSSRTARFVADMSVVNETNRAVYRPQQII